MERNALQALASSDSTEKGDLARAQLAAQRAEMAKKRGGRMEKLKASLSLAEIRSRVAKILGLGGTTASPAASTMEAPTNVLEGTTPTSRQPVDNSPAEVRAKIEALTEGDPTILLRFAGLVKSGDPEMRVVQHLDTGTPAEQAQAAKTLAGMIEEATTFKPVQSPPSPAAKPTPQAKSPATTKPIVTPTPPPPQVPRQPGASNETTKPKATGLDRVIEIFREERQERATLQVSQPGAKTTPAAPTPNLTPDQLQAEVDALMASGDVRAIVAFNQSLERLDGSRHSLALLAQTRKTGNQREDARLDKQRVEAAKTVERALELTLKAKAEALEVELERRRQLELDEKARSEYKPYEENGITGLERVEATFRRERGLPELPKHRYMREKWAREQGRSKK